MRGNRSGCLFGLFLWFVSVSTGWAQNGYSWQLGAPMLLARQELATGLLDGRVYVIGGYDAAGASTDTVQVYNPTTDTWTFVHAIPYAVNHNSAAVAGGKLYSFGAGGGETFVYDPNANSWAARASSHYVHSYTAAVGVINDQIYVAGGTGTPSQRELELYDPVANTWTIKAPMSVPRNHTAGGVINGKFYVVGGRLTNGSASTNALEMYDPQTNTWSTRAPMPTARSGLAAAVVNNELWVFGGEDIDTVHGEVEVYDPVSNTWRQEPGMPLPRHGIWASVMGNKIYLPGGGAIGGLAPTNTNQIFNVDVLATPTPTPTSTSTPTVTPFQTPSPRPRPTSPSRATRPPRLSP
jgi:N-acetylneuraminic acid mutarotase